VLLCDLFRVLRCDVQMLVPPSEPADGLLVVSHPEFIDPGLLAEAIGMPQPGEDGDDPATEGGDCGGGPSELR